VESLAGLAGPGTRVLECAIGGGRVALPLARRGLQVEGVEAPRRWCNGCGRHRAARRSRSTYSGLGASRW
jgi:hypothetical protein